jgi:hypothetical protein
MRKSTVVILTVLSILLVTQCSDCAEAVIEQFSIGKIGADREPGYRKLDRINDVSMIVFQAAGMADALTTISSVLRGNRETNPIPNMVISANDPAPVKRMFVINGTYGLVNYLSLRVYRADYCNSKKCKVAIIGARIAATAAIAYCAHYNAGI